MTFRTGIDILEIERIRKLMTTSEARFLSRHFTEQEVRYCRSRSDPAVHFAGRLAAKEAMYKALHLSWKKGFSWKQIEILPSQEGFPVVQLHSDIQTIFQSSGFVKSEISISHTKFYAAASALIWSFDRLPG